MFGVYSNAGVMVGTGAEPVTGLSKSTVAEWNEQVNNPHFPFLPHHHTLIISSSSKWQINVVGLVFFAIALIPLVEKSSEKRVVNITSMLGDLGYHEKNPHLHFSSYSVTKAGVTMANLKFHHE